MRRTFQQGQVFQKGRKSDEKWDPEAPAYVRFWVDVPGSQMDPSKRQYQPLGRHRTRTTATRAAAEVIERLGINSTQRFIESTSSVTFRLQAETWLKSLSARKRNPLEQTTIDTRRYALDKWIHPFFEGRLVAEVNNRSMKEFVEHIGHLAASTIRDYSNIVKDVVASAIDENGEELFPRKWNEKYIDAPVVRHQNQPTTDSDGIRSIVDAAHGQFRVLYALLAGCGPLRAGEALGLDIANVSKDFRTLRIVQKAKRGILQPYLKTQAGEREVDLCTDLSNVLREFIGSRKTGLLFSTVSGRQLLQSNTLQDSLHPILKKLGLPMGGFNIFRRYRLTHVAKTECPESLRHFWSGHAQRHVSERYIKMLADRDFRLEWAERIGTGFPLGGRPGRLEVVRKTA